MILAVPIDKSLYADFDRRRRREADGIRECFDVGIGFSNVTGLDIDKMSNRLSSKILFEQFNNVQKLHR